MSSVIVGSWDEVVALDPDGNRDVWRLRCVSLDRGWEWHDGAGFYLTLYEYPEEGSVGAFATRDAAIDWVRESGGLLLEWR